MARWRLQGGKKWLTGEAATGLLRARIDAGQLETWFESDAGQALAVVTNTERAMVAFFERAGDEGQHAVELAAAPRQAGGYRLSNGQIDSYAERDTLPLTLAMQCVRITIEMGEPDPGVSWHDDRV